jgi:putative oxidoreductase
MTATVTASTTEAIAGKGLRVWLWVSQSLLALVFAPAGAMKLINTSAFVAQSHMSAGLLIFIGISEVAGALGVVLPALTRVYPQLTAFAAVGLAVIMVLATGVNIMQGQLPAVALTIVLGALAVFVAWGRWRRAPIAPRL